MPPVPFNNVIEVEVRFVQDLQHSENTLYFYKTSDLAAGDAQDVADGVLGLWVLNLLPLQCPNVQLFEVYAKSLDPSLPIEATATPSSPIFGGNGDPALPNNVTIAVSFRTGLTGRSNRGRNYFVGLSENQVVNNQVNATPLANIVAGYEEFMNFATTVPGFVWVVASRYSNGDPRTTGAVAPITSVLVTDAIIDSQRRRLPGRGR